MSAIVDEGVSLLSVVEAGRSRKRLDELSVARVIADVAEALDAPLPRAQPLSPNNILLLRSGAVKLDGKTVAETDLVAYTAPERLRGQSGDHRSDVFTLGVVMWESLTHERLFEGFTDDAVKTAVLEGEIHPPSEQNANIPSELDAICLRALARDAVARYPTAKAMAVEIEGVLRDAGYGRNNEPIATYVQQLPKESFRKATKAALPMPKVAPAITPNPPKLPSKPPADTIVTPTPPPEEPVLLTKVVEDKTPDNAKDLVKQLRETVPLKTSPVSTLVGLAEPKPPAKPAETKPATDKKANDKATEKAIAEAIDRAPDRVIDKAADTVHDVPSPLAKAESKPVLADGKQTLMGVPSAAPAAAKPGAVTMMGVPSAAPEGKPLDGKQTVMGVPSLADSLPPSSKPVDTIMGVPSLAAVLPEPPAPPLVPSPPKLPANVVPPQVASAVTQAIAPVTPVEPPVDDEFGAEPSPHPAEAVSLPRTSENGTGNRDVLAGWGWSTGAQEAIDDEPLDEIPPPSKRPLLIAIGSAVGVLGLITVIAFAGGKSDDGDKRQAAAVAHPAPPADPTPPPPPAKPDPAQPDPAASPSQPDPAKPDPAAAPSQPDPAKPDPAAAPDPAKPEPAKVEPPKPEPAKVEPPKPEPAKPEPPKVEPPKPDPKLAAKPEPKKPDPKLKPEPPKPEPPKLAKKPDPPKPAVKKPPEPKPKAVAAKPVDPYPDAKPAAKPKVDADTAYRTGLQLFARGDTSGALSSLQAARDTNPRYPPTWRGLGMVYEKLGDRASAANAYRRYLQLAPRAGDADTIRGRLEHLGS